MPAITGIDHLLIDVEDLEGAHATWHRLGFTMTPRGRHVGRGTGNQCAMLPQVYLELIGIVDEAEYAANAFRRTRVRGTGLTAVAVAMDDADEAVRRLRDAGLPVEAPRDLSRLLEADEGVLGSRFHIILLPEGTSPAITMFLCAHLTPELIHRPAWLTHDNGALALQSVAVPVADPAGMAEAYRRLLGPGAVTMTDALVTVRIGGTSLVLTRPQDMEMLFPYLQPEDAPPPAVVTVRIANLNASAEVLAARHVPFRRDLRSLAIGSEDACGVALVFAV
ncbi:MAG: VOC family protein [Proteobacteria bacterium]|nr:VOC family protein [Pseudomonadota bacterium]